MKQFNPGDKLVDGINYEDPSLPETISTLRPVVYTGTTQYHCLLGPNEETGIFASGRTVQEALMNWDNILQEVIKRDDQNNEVTRFVIDLMNVSRAKSG